MWTASGLSFAHHDLSLDPYNQFFESPRSKVLLVAQKKSDHDLSPLRHLRHTSPLTAPSARFHGLLRLG